MGEVIFLAIVGQPSLVRITTSVEIVVGAVDLQPGIFGIGAVLLQKSFPFTGDF